MSMKKVYYVNCSKVESSSGSGAGTNDVYDPKWPHFERMSFLKETRNMDPMVSFFNVQENTLTDFFETTVLDNSNLERATTPEELVFSYPDNVLNRSSQISLISIDETDLTTTAPDIHEDINDDAITTTPKQSTSVNRKNIRSGLPVPPPKRKKIGENLSDAALLEACNTLKQIQETTSSNKENNNDCDDDAFAYGVLVKNRIRSLQPNIKRNFVRELQSLLNKYIK